MSRAGTTKGSKEKTKATVPQTPVIITEIVKGKFSENDWISMVERDDEEEYIVGIVDEIVNSTLDSIYRRYIDKQVVPFTITKAKEAVLLLIEWHFLARDEGEKTFDEFCWVEDDEPNGSTIDSWAQGTVPKVYVPLTMCSTEETNDLLPVTTTKDSDMETKGKEFSNGIIEEDVVELPEECKPERNEKFDDTTSLGKQAKRKKTKTLHKFRPYQGKIKPTGVDRMTESLDDTELQFRHMDIVDPTPYHSMSSQEQLMASSRLALLKLHNTRPPGSKDVLFDEFGKVISVAPLDMEKLPNHRVTLKYNLMHQSNCLANARCLERVAVRSRLASDFPTHHRNVNVKSDDTFVTGGIQRSGRNGPRSPLQPSLFDTIDVSPGVVVIESGRTKKGPGHYARKPEPDVSEENLRPVTYSFKQHSAISVSDLLDRSTPIIRPFNGSHILPPITSTASIIM